VLKPYTFPKPVKMTPYNRMIQINKPMFDDKAWEPQKLKIFDGPLYNPGILFAETEDDDGLSVYLEWDNEQGADTDIGIGIVHDEVSEMTFYAEEIRAGAFLRVHLTLGDHPDLSKLHTYLVFSTATFERYCRTGGGVGNFLQTRNRYDQGNRQSSQGKTR
jgi:hypothetical protein